MGPRFSGRSVFCTKYFSSVCSLRECRLPFLCLTRMCLVYPRGQGQVHVGAQQLVPPSHASVLLRVFSVFRGRPEPPRFAVVLLPPGLPAFPAFPLLQWRGSCSLSISIFFPNAEKKVFILIIKISLFCILQYISNISTMKHS